MMQAENISIPSSRSSNVSWLRVGGWFFLALVLASSPGCSGPATVSGKVLDEYGNPLSNVQLHVTSAVATQYEPDAYGGERTIHLDDGTFKVRCSNCSAIHLFFSKEGYHPKPLDLAWFEKTRGLTIVLLRKGEPVDLKKVSAELFIGPADEQMGLAFDNDVGSEQKLDELRATSSTATVPHITFLPSLNADGSLAAIRQHGQASKLQTMVLDFSAANGGVQIYRPSTRVIHYAFAEMTAAPQDGYQDTVTVDTSGDFDNTYFYCVIDGRYCKGYVGPPAVGILENAESVRVSVEMYLSPYLAHRSMENARGYVR